MNGYVMQAQPLSVNDGDGIRTTIFLAGCPLRCRWCSNPEGFSSAALVGWYQNLCISCGECVRSCPNGIGVNLNAERSKCDACGACAEVCPKGARKQLVSLKSADEIIAEAERYGIFYRKSGGGITFSGGEATSQPALLDYLSHELYEKGYSLDLETCGYFDFDEVRPSLERLDLIFCDIKHMDEDVHLAYTGVSNDIILKNVKRLGELDAEIVIRIPVIGGVNDDDENVRRTAAFVHENLPAAKMELLPYHKLGTIKYEALGLASPYDEFFTPDAERMDFLRSIVKECGVGAADFR